MMHGKTMLLDGQVVMVGSTNLDPLSLNHMDEGAIVAVDERLAHEEERRFLQDLTHAAERVQDVRRTAAR
jgi:cardiolipin synthase